ncbi:MAG: DUF421 domain-containing protein [Clostridia bacterium]|nr:DUF421 domain-containing protein [Clostridia bacterium]
MDFLKLIFSSLLSALALFLIAKIMGHKQMAQLNFFDYSTGITIGSIAAELATELEAPWKPLSAMVIYGVISVSLSLITSKSHKMRKYINGTPTIIMNNGKLYRKNMKKSKLDLSEFMVMCHQQGFFNLNDIQTAVFEYNGHITILPKSDKRPITPFDMNISPEKETIFTEIIMDGKIIHDNIKRKGLDLIWLEKELNNQGYKNAKEIFLAVCDDKNTVSFYPFN